MRFNDMWAETYDKSFLQKKPCDDSTFKQCQEFKTRHYCEFKPCKTKKYWNLKLYPVLSLTLLGVHDKKPSRSIFQLQSKCFFCYGHRLPNIYISQIRSLVLVPCPWDQKSEQLSWNYVWNMTSQWSDFLTPPLVSLILWHSTWASMLYPTDKQFCEVQSW